MKRGEIYYLSIPTNTTTGCEIMYDRPAIIVSHDALNATSGTVTVIPCSTSMRRKMRCHVEIGSASRACHAMIEQLTTVDKSRLSNRVGELTPEEMHRLDAAMADFLALPTSGEAVEGERETCAWRTQRSWIAAAIPWRSSYRSRATARLTRCARSSQSISTSTTICLDAW